MSPAGWGEREKMVHCRLGQDPLRELVAHYEEAIWRGAVQLNSKCPTRCAKPNKPLMEANLQARLDGFRAVRVSIHR